MIPSLDAYCILRAGYHSLMVKQTGRAIACASVDERGSCAYRVISGMLTVKSAQSFSEQYSTDGCAAFPHILFTPDIEAVMA